MQIISIPVILVSITTNTVFIGNRNLLEDSIAKKWLERSFEHVFE